MASVDKSLFLLKGALSRGGGGGGGVGVGVQFLCGNFQNAPEN